MKTDVVKGFRDYEGIEAEKKEAIRKILVETFEKYGFESAETPVVEAEEFVKGENANDEAVSDIFKLKDKGKRKLALRYELTFSLKRLMNNKKLPYKRYQIGPVFRDEPTQGNRLRQFIQGDVDVIGVGKVPAREEAEVLSVANEILTKIGLTPKILINNRKLMNEILQDAGVKEKDKEEVLRIIDKYDKIPEREIKTQLKKFRAEKILGDLKKGEKFFKNFESYKEIISLIEYCRLYGIEVSFSPTMVRGLSYYNGSVFEIKAEGIKETISAGGSFVFNGVQCTGISLGIERLCVVADFRLDKDKYLIVSLEQDSKAVKIAQKLRKKNIVSVYYGKPSKALEYANSYKYNKVVFVGEKEVKAKKFKIKNMKTGKESFLKL